MLPVKDTKPQQNTFVSTVKNRDRRSASMQSAEPSLDSLYFMQRNLGNAYLQATHQLKEASSVDEVDFVGQQTASENNAGLPDQLKAGIENLSGLAMDDVRVHYNSSKPAQLQGLAYTQGTEIHVGPGQERHLPHEAWHVVQQMQGRVRATMQMVGVQVNDEERLEKEADVMGNKALTAEDYDAGQKQPSIPMNSGPNPIQMSGFTASNAPSLETVVTLIKKKTGVAADKMGLPFNKGIASVTERAGSITAAIDNSTVSDAKRKDDKSKLSKITGMARDESFILIGADPQKFYNAGHLVGDQLLKKLGDGYSFELKNLAPQVSNFNSPAYVNVMEEPIREAAAGGKKIEVNVELTYPKDYVVPVSTLIERGIVNIESADDKKGTVDIEDGEKNIKPTDEITFPRRIPKTWKMTAKETSGGTLSKFNLGSDQKAVEKLLFDPSDLAKKDLSLKKPFKFIIGGVDKSSVPVTAVTKGTDKIDFEEVRDRILDAKQWKPPKASKITKEELAGALNFFFPNVEDKQLNDFFGIFKEKNFETIESINREMLQIMAKITGINVPFDDFENFRIRIIAALANARKSLGEGDENSLKIYLQNAVIVLSEFKKRSQKLVEEANNFKIKIKEYLEEIKLKNNKSSETLASLGKTFSTESLLAITQAQLRISSLYVDAFNAKDTDLAKTLELIKQIDTLNSHIDEIIAQERKRIERALSQPPTSEPLSLSLTLDQPVPDHKREPGAENEGESDPKKRKGDNGNSQLS